jgi:hypothetical protein
MINSIFQKTNWKVILSGGVLFVLLAANPVFADYSGHVASFKSENNAANFVDQMKTKGFVAYYKKENVPGKGEFFRVFLGGYKTMPLAQKALAKLKKDGEIDFFMIEKTSEQTIETSTVKKEPVAQTGKAVQKPAMKTDNKKASAVDTHEYYSGVEGIVLKNGKVIKGQIISIDENDVLKIRTKQGKILSYSFTKDVREYITKQIE